MESLLINFEQEIEIPATGKRPARKAKLAVRFSPVQLRTPYRFDCRDPLNVYAVYATEIDCPEGETPLSWMLLTTEVVDSIEMAATILRWYTDRWRIEEYHKILKSGCQAEQYRLAGDENEIHLEQKSQSQNRLVAFLTGLKQILCPNKA